MAEPPGRTPQAPEDAGWLPHFRLRDVLDTRGHSRDFSGSRAEYIHQRVHSLCIVLAVLMVLWIPVDFFAVADAEFSLLVLARVAAAAVLLLIGLRRRPLHRLRSALAQLAALMAVVILFYIDTRVSIDGQVSAAVIMGYGFFPFVLIALQAVFPLTLVEGVLLALPVLLAVVGVNVYVGEALDLSSLGNIWLLLMLMAIAWWAQTAQLDMLMRLYRQASRDPLTNLFNRRVLMDRLLDESRRSRRYGRNLALLMLDLDRFKRINDRAGHLAGDAVLREFAEVLVEQLRNVDLIGRYGGEEFVAVLPETGLQGAREVAERIRNACREHPARAVDGDTVDYTVSIGVTLFKPDENVESALDRADRALYQAKSEGRDRVVLASDLPLTEDPSR